MPVAVSHKFVAVRRRRLRTNVLDSDEVLASRSAGGDRSRDRVLVPAAPGIRGKVATRIANALLKDLEPLARAIIAHDVVTGRTRHVHERGARVLHRGADAEREGDGVARVERQDLGAARVAEGALVAADVVAVGEGAVADVLGRVGGELDGVVVRRARELADVLEGGRAGAVDGADVEEVVRGRHLGDGCEGEGRGLHGDSVYLEKRGWLIREGEAKREENRNETERMI